MTTERTQLLQELKVPYVLCKSNQHVGASVCTELTDAGVRRGSKVGVLFAPPDWFHEFSGEAVMLSLLPLSQ